eukprot:CAMPEP_0182941688 /NCGR_PEP_ID=MMETSP0105_2-20130417/49337_1 /TAXON_ID=81532 ORGANISM="Acanthoeca-like sp., Strain 10tr" /NCGR_SAMPLE_ID=MMETSP0105_2 /ASSEMBLY_ACC=CAM_ASM_000205 /LENGTH=49 /DNA_ID= /DNA_START= /DNA_END= /DNA_ORIENTATION=
MNQREEKFRAAISGPLLVETSVVLDFPERTLKVGERVANVSSPKHPANL